MTDTYLVCYAIHDYESRFFVGVGSTMIAGFRPPADQDEIDRLSEVLTRRGHQGGLLPADHRERVIGWSRLSD